MVVNCAPPIIDLFSYCYKSQFMDNLKTHFSYVCKTNLLPWILKTIATYIKFLEIDFWADKFQVTFKSSRIYILHGCHFLRRVCVCVCVSTSVNAEFFNRTSEFSISELNGYIQIEIYIWQKLLNYASFTCYRVYWCCYNACFLIKSFLYDQYDRKSIFSHPGK